MKDEELKEFISALGADLVRLREEQPEKYLELLTALREFYHEVNESLEQAS